MLLPEAYPQRLRPLSEQIRELEESQLRKYSAIWQREAMLASLPDGEALITRPELLIPIRCPKCAWNIRNGYIIQQLGRAAQLAAGAGGAGPTTFQSKVKLYIKLT